MIDVELDLDAHRREPVDLRLDDVLGQAELGDAVDEDAARGVERLEDRDVVAELGELARGGQPGRPGADDADLLAGRARRTCVRQLAGGACAQSATKRSR